MNTKEEVLNDIAKEIYGKTYDDLRSVTALLKIADGFDFFGGG